MFPLQVQQQLEAEKGGKLNKLEEKYKETQRTIGEANRTVQVLVRLFRVIFSLFSNSHSYYFLNEL